MNLHAFIAINIPMQVLSQDLEKTSLVLAYMGPQTVLPLASFIAAIVGFVLIFWRFVAKVVRRFFNFIFRRGHANDDAISPLDDK